MKNIELNEVYTFKVYSGEEVVAKVVEIDEDYLELQEPLTVMPNAQGMGLMPSMFTADRDKIARLNTSAIIMYGVCAEQIRVKYIEATTGIATAPKKIVLG